MTRRTHTAAGPRSSYGLGLRRVIHMPAGIGQGPAARRPAARCRRGIPAGIGAVIPILAIGLLQPVPRPAPAPVTGPGPARDHAAQVARVPGMPGKAPAPVPAGDEVVTGVGDVAGWHIEAASSGDGWRWHALATLRPGGVGDESWIGQQCVTGDGRLVVAVVAPWHANDSGPGMDRGGVAYAIDAHTGVARPLVSGVSLAYFNPGCGTGDRVALTSYLGSDEHTTRVTVVNAADGMLAWSRTVRGELTSAVPSGPGILAAAGSAVVRLAAQGAPAVAARAGGQVFDLRPNSAGGADFLAAAGQTGQVWQLAGVGVRLVGSGALRQVGLFAGRGGHNLVIGARQASPGARDHWPVAAGLPRFLAGPGRLAVLGRSAGPSPPVAGVSAGGGMLLEPAAPPRRTAGFWVTLRPTGTGPARGAALPLAGRKVSADLPRLDLAAAGGPVVPPADGRLAAAAATANTTTPACAVPRNDLWTQVPQPNSAQVQWAVQQAVRGWLVPGNIPARPASPQDYLIGDTQQLPQFYPSQDFPPPAIAGYSGAVVPPQVMYGILAQESNWNQASWHALSGYGGNPLVANYYGSTNPANPTDINYDNAECGYGIAQITDNMQAGAGNINTQTAIAVDYAENIAAAVSTLIGKWNQLASLGIKMNDGDPARIENWYAAIWAYNSGVHMVANGDPADGLGWFNNPANPIYPVSRHPFLCADSTCTSYTDANTPQNWPYQEKVFGWIEAGQFDPNNPTSSRFTPLGWVLDIPSHNTFCNPGVNVCDPELIGKSDPCPDESSSCWWDQSAQWADCASQCTPGSFTITSPSAPEPAPPPRPGECANTSGLSPGALIVDDTALTGQNPSRWDPNVQGCPLSPPWQSAGTFSLEDSVGQQLSPADVASIDLHQIGAGFGGHTWFTHTRPASDSAHEVIAAWTPDLTTSGIYQIQAFIPSPGATATNATYLVDGTYPRTVNQNSYDNQWVSLGFFPLYPGASVTLGSVTAASDASQGADIAFNALAFTPVPPHSYVALGDSLDSGEGTGGPWNAGTDVQANNGAQADNLCHRSPNGYPAQYAQLSHTFRYTAVVDLACSGSNLYDLDHISYSIAADGTVTYPSTSHAAPGGTLAYSEPGDQVNMLRQIPDPQLVTLSIGINDAGFAGILRTCIGTFLAYIQYNTGPTCQQYYTNPDGSNVIDKMIQGLRAPMTQALKDVKAAVPADTNITLVTYPEIFNAASGPCALMLTSDVQWLMSEAHAFDQMLVSAANSAGISYLYEEHVLAGHEFCTDTPWARAPLNASSWNVTDPSVQNNFFHPLTPGYGAMAQDLNNYLNTQGIP